MPFDPHLAALQRAGLVSASQSPFRDTFQLVTNGQPGASIAAHDMVQQPVDLTNESGGLVRSEQLSFAVLKKTLSSPPSPRSLIAARNSRWIIETVSGEDPAQASWKIVATKQ